MRTYNRTPNLLAFCFTIASFFFIVNDVKAADALPYDSTRIMHTLAKAQRGEPITIGVLGGSITAGYAASTESTRWANQVATWWEEQFPQSEVTLINAGIGGTGSDIGTHRVYNDLLIQNPDFIVVEFSVNDTEGELAKKMMEGLVRQILAYDNQPALMMLTLMQDDGTTALASHKPVAEHYAVPIANFAELIPERVAQDDHTLQECFVDGLHPNDLGMGYIADFITEELQAVLNILPEDDQLPEINTDLPEPLVTDTYATTYSYTNQNLVSTASEGWEQSTSGWISETAGATISFTVEGNAISIIYTQHNTTTRGRAEAWVNDGTPVVMDAYFDEDWGPATRFALIAEGLEDGEHTLNIRILEENHPNSTGHYFAVQNVLKAGNITNTHPIAKAGENIKTVVETPITLDGSESFDPDGDPLTYSWTLEQTPEGSVAGIENSDQSVAGFTPDANGVYLIGLTVDDGTYSSVTSIKRILAKASNEPPVAVAGSDITVATNSGLDLDGTESYDPDGDPILFLWSLISQPEGSNAIIINPNTHNPRITPRVDGEYVVELVVNDSIADSEPSTITITAIADYTSAGTLDQPNSQLNMLLYPNPTNGTVNIKATADSDETLEVTLYSSLGVRIKSFSSKMLSGSNEQTIDLKQLNLPKGTYLLNIRMGAQSETQRIVYI